MKQGSRYSVVITNSGTDKKSALSGSKSPVMGTGLPVMAGIETGQTFYKSASETARWTDGKTKNWTARIKAHTRTLNQSWVPDTPVFQVKAYNSGYNLISWEKSFRSYRILCVQKKRNRWKVVPKLQMSGHRN